MILCPLLSSGQTLACSLPKSQLSSSLLSALHSPLSVPGDSPVRWEGGARPPYPDVAIRNVAQ